MAKDHHIQNFTAVDIEKYHKGQLSPVEMHAMERAALDDPFLADALEGYAVQGVNVSNDIAELKKRLAGQTEKAKVIPIGTTRSSLPWLRAAVAVVLIFGAGLLIYQFGFNKDVKEEAITQAPATKKTPTSNEKAVADTLKGMIDPGKDLQDEKASGIAAGTEEKDGDDEKSGYRSEARKDQLNKEPAALDYKIADPATAPPLAEAKSAEEKEALKLNEVLERKTSGIDSKPDSTASNRDTRIANNVPNEAATGRANAGVVVMDDTKAKKESYYRNPIVFRGTVTDATNTPLPFANITNRRDNVGTYSDAQGNFTLVSPDSVMDVQVRSLGFENNNAQLRGDVSNNRIVLQEDRSLNARVLDTVKRNIARSRSQSFSFEEPEPEDGWPAYNSYVLNNLNMPEKFDMKKSGGAIDNTVEISFEVNRNGEPINIKVEKSLCEKCDKEAIRLLKDGPKWKRKAKKGRKTITIPFLKTD